MRITAGDLRGRVIQAPDGLDVRPTSDRARQAVFNILEHAPWSEGLQARRVIDAFAGSGALGLEALSHGAASCLFIDLAEASLAAVRANVAAFGLGARARLLRQDATRLGRRPEGDEPYDLVFLDPPYGKGLGAPALMALRGGGWLAADAIAVLEHGAGEAAVERPGFERLDQRRYGKAEVLFLRPVGPG
ncbi:MAG TPA: 16S rRNA (guanine(966)-N(2))-methyltransferase RsmD [Caulobacteraceae bacterium]